MRDYILSLTFLVAVLGGYTALVLNHQPDTLVKNQATAKQDRIPGSSELTD